MDKQFTKDFTPGQCSKCLNFADFCKGNRGSTVIHHYNFRPTRKWLLDTGESKKEDTLFFGIELELESEEQRDCDHCSEEPCALCPDPGISRDQIRCIYKAMPFTYVKEDGSLDNGIEIATHPMTFRWFRSNFYRFDVLNYLASKGWDTPSSCGLHIHMDKKAFTTFHFYKFARFFSDNHSFIKTISGRTQHALDQWGSIKSLLYLGHAHYSEEEELSFCNCEDCRNTRRLRRLGRTSIGHRRNPLAKFAKNKCQDAGRQTAINGWRTNTYEIRIFAGSIKPEVLAKDIEFCHSLWQFTMWNKLKNITIDYYRDFVYNKKKDYPYLAGFLKKYDRRGARKK